MRGGRGFRGRRREGERRGKRRRKEKKREEEEKRGFRKSRQKIKPLGIYPRDSTFSFSLILIIRFFV